MEKRERSIEPNKRLITKVGKVAENVVYALIKGPKGYFPNILEENRPKAWFKKNYPDTTSDKKSQ